MTHPARETAAHASDIPDWGWQNIDVETPAPHAWIEIDELPDPDPDRVWNEDVELVRRGFGLGWDGMAPNRPTIAAPRHPRGFTGRYVKLPKGAQAYVMPDDGEDEVDGEDDEYSALAAAVERETAACKTRLAELEGHALVREYGFVAKGLLPFGFDILAVATEACAAARELGRREACRVLGIQDKGQTLASVGVDRLFKTAGDLQAAVAEVVAQREAAERKARLRGGIRPRRAAPPVPAPAPRAPRQPRAPAQWPCPAESERPSGLFGTIGTTGAFRCTCGCNADVPAAEARVPSWDAMKARQDGEAVYAADLWRHALDPRCARRLSGRGNGFSLAETRQAAQGRERWAAVYAHRTATMSRGLGRHVPSQRG